MKTELSCELLPEWITSIFQKVLKRLLRVMLSKYYLAMNTKCYNNHLLGKKHYCCNNGMELTGITNRSSVWI